MKNPIRTLNPLFSCLLAFSLSLSALSTPDCTASMLPSGRAPANGVGRGGGDLVLTRYLLALQLAQVGIKTFAKDQRYPEFKPYAQAMLNRLARVKLEVSPSSYGLYHRMFSTTGDVLPLYLNEVAAQSPADLIAQLTAQQQVVYIDRNAIEQLPGDLVTATIRMLEVGAILAPIPSNLATREYLSRIAAAAFNKTHSSSASQLLSLVVGTKAADNYSQLVRDALAISRRAMTAPMPYTADMEVESYRESISNILDRLTVGKNVALLQTTIEENKVPKAAYAALSPEATTNQIMAGLSVALRTAGLSPVLSQIPYDRIAEATNDRVLVYVSVPYLHDYRPKAEEIAALLIHEAGHLAGFVGPSSHERLDRFANSMLVSMGYAVMPRADLNKIF